MGDMILETRSLVKTFRGHNERALDRVSLRIPEGSVYGLLGPNGAGKSTLLKIITGMMRPDSGEVRFHGKSWTRECLRDLVDASQTEKERKRLEARNQEIDGMFLSLYTDKAKGVLTEQRFMKLTAALEQEQESNQKRLHDLAMMQSRADAQEGEVRTFIKEIRRYATIEELDEAVLNRLISRILIGEVKKVDGQKVQEVRIVYNFVGEIPEIAA